MHAGFGAYFRTANDLVTDLGRAYREGRLDRHLRIYLAPKVLGCLDVLADALGAHVASPPFGNRIYEATVPLSVTGIMRRLAVLPYHVRLWYIVT